jgi:hypothetical protein
MVGRCGQGLRLNRHDIALLFAGGPFQRRARWVLCFVAEGLPIPGSAQSVPVVKAQTAPSGGRPARRPITRPTRSLRCRG